MRRLLPKAKANCSTRRSMGTKKEHWEQSVNRSGKRFGGYSKYWMPIFQMVSLGMFLIQATLAFMGSR